MKSFRSVDRRFGEQLTALETIEVEQVGEQPLELPGVGCDPPDHVERVVAWQVELGALERQGRAQDGRERRSEVVGYGLQEGVLHLIKHPKTLRCFTFALEGIGELLLLARSARSARLCSVMSTMRPRNGSPGSPPRPGSATGSWNPSWRPVAARNAILECLARASFDRALQSRHRFLPVALVDVSAPRTRLVGP